MFCASRNAIQNQLPGESRKKKIACLQMQAGDRRRNQEFLSGWFCFRFLEIEQVTNTDTGAERQAHVSG